MLSFTTATLHPHVLLSPPHHSLLNHVKRLRNKREKPQSLSFVSMECGFSFLGRRDFNDSVCGKGGFLRRCKNGFGGTGDLELEAEILEFMKESKNPEAFPSKKELIDAGRLDLVEGVMQLGGWLAFGWDSESEESGKDWNFEGGGVDFDRRSSGECNSEVIQEMGFEGNEESFSEVGFFDVESNFSASSSSRPLEAAAESESGIDGILSRLERERGMNCQIGLRERAKAAGVQTNDLKHEWLLKAPKNGTVSVQKRSNAFAPLNPNSGKMNDSGGKMGQSSCVSKTDGFRNSLKPDSWRTWSAQRAGFSNIEFEAGEVSFDKSSTGSAMDALQNELQVTRDDASGFGKGIDHIRSHLQQLEFELSSSLGTLKSSAGEIVSQKLSESSSDDMLKLSDAWEFQENEIMNVRDKLRSIRAKLAVLEGKMALTLIDAQKIAEEKQKRIDDARRALRLLRTACIVWPNSASEVLLAGSFDGWTTKRRMEKSSTGVFSLYMKLYPGKYEIKFIVDGEWKVDPLRPIVHYSGHENNLLIIT